MPATSGKSFVEIPARVWYVHANGSLDSSWPTRSAARTRKSTLRGTAASTTVVLSSSAVTVAPAVTDTHS